MRFDLPTCDRFNGRNRTSSIGGVVRASFNFLDGGCRLCFDGLQYSAAEPAPAHELGLTEHRGKRRQRASCLIGHRLDSRSNQSDYDWPS
jgi:hypothetical protein